MEKSHFEPWESATRAPKDAQPANASETPSAAETEETEEAPESSTAPEMTIDPVRLAQLMARLEDEQNLPLGALAGLGAGLVTAAMWAALTVATGYQIGWVAIGVGIVVGLCVRHSGKGLSKTFGVIGAGCALFGCALGNLLSVCAFVSINQNLSFWSLTGHVLINPPLAWALIAETFSPIDLLFYGLAIHQGYRCSFRQITAEELAELTVDSPTEPG